MPSTITVAAPPNTADAASQALALMAALSGVLTDYNQGSQIRTIAESFGSVIEQSAVQTQALAYQALVYSAMSLFGIVPNGAIAATGVVTFSTSTGGSPPPASQNVTIPAGTLVQTGGGIQFQTTTTAVLGAGSSSIDVAVQAVIPGSAGNVPIAAINTIISGLTYPLFVKNAAATANGTDAETAAQSLARFTAAVTAIGLSSPVAIANAAVGVTYGAETVRWATLFEPWIAAGSGVGSGVAGWELYIDNGSGVASSGLINAVDVKLSGGVVSGAANASGEIGYRDAGVPYNIYSVTPTYAVVGVTGVVAPNISLSLVSGAIDTAIKGYFQLPFGTTAEQAQIAAAVANSALGALDALTVSLFVSGSGTPTSGVTTSPSGRVLLGQLTQSLTAAG